MRTIHKFEIQISNETQSIEIAKDSRCLAVEHIIPKRSLFVWFEVPADMTAPKITRSFRVFKTGDGIPDHFEYRGTSIDQYLPESYHLYEMIGEISDQNGLD